MSTLRPGNGAISGSHTFAGLGTTDYALSPDGARVAWFQRTASSTDGLASSELWVGDVSGGAPTRILALSGSTNEIDSAPAWSPNGRQIAFARTLEGQADNNATPYRISISLIDSDGSDLHELTNRASSRAEFSWSPDGRWVAFAGYPDEAPFPLPGETAPAEDIFVVAVDGTHERRLTRTAADESEPLWAPDGTHIAYLTSGAQTVRRCR